MKEFAETRGEVIALNEDTGNADREAEMRAFMLNFNGVVSGKHTSDTREADADDARALGIKKGTIIRNVRNITVITVNELRAIGLAMGVPVTAADLRVNLAVKLQQEPENISGVPGISNIPTGSQLVFDNGVILVAQHPLFPCNDTGKRIAEKYKQSSEGKDLNGGEFGLAALVEKTTDEERRRYSRRGLATTVGSLGQTRNQGPEHSSIHVGHKFTLKPPPEWYIPLKRKE